MSLDEIPVKTCPNPPNELHYLRIQKADFVPFLGDFVEGYQSREQFFAIQLIEPSWKKSF
jgi:hypothetical protein